jgi:hypothetical protein
MCKIFTSKLTKNDRWTLVKFIKIIGICFFIAVVSTLIYLYPTFEYATDIAQFNGGTVYFHNYLIKTGHLLQRDQIQTFGLFSNSIYGQTETPMDTIYRVIKDIVIVSDSKLNYSAIYYLFAGLIFALSILLFYSSESKNLIDYIVICSFVLLGAPYIISNINGNAVTGWTLIALSLYTYTKKEDARMRLLTIIFLISLPLTYFTPASMLLLILTTLIVYKALAIKDYKISFQMTLLYFILWISTGMYISVGRFTGTLNLFTKIFEILKSGLIPGTVSVGSDEITSYLISTEVLNKIILLINSIFVAIPVIYFIFIGHKKFEKYNELLHVLWGFTLSLIPLTILLYFWLGLWGVTRLSEWGSILSFIIAASMIGKVSVTHKRYLTYFMVIAVTISVFAYTTNENKPTTYLTFEEQYSADWLINHIQNEKSVFTDFRVAGYFVGNGHLRVTGVNNIDNPPMNKSIKLIESIYYSNDSTRAKIALDEIRLKNNNQKMNYLLFSNQFTKNVPGIKLYDYAFKPAPNNFTKKYDEMNYIYRIYDNGNSCSYVLS